jgi:hypothetical protein
MSIKNRPSFLLKFEQLLLIRMLDLPINFRTQKIYKNRVNFYKAIWKLRDMKLVFNRDIKINGMKAKEWKLTLDGIIVARILAKGIDKDEIQNHNNKHKN